MRDPRIECLLHNAFNGVGDMCGEDDFGYSVAWMDLNDFLEVPSGIDTKGLRSHYTDDVTRWVKTAPGVDGERYILLYLDANGDCYAVAYTSRENVRAAYTDHVRAYAEWWESQD